MGKVKYMTLSICSICQDEEDLIPFFLNCCKYIHSQLGDNLKEVIVIDGGSKDKTWDILVSYLPQMSLVLKQVPFDTFGQQKNRALELATGDFILGLDADMTISKNFPDVFKSGFFNRANFWDFPMLFTVQDAYHYFYKWGIHNNMRMWKRGPKFKTNFHEKLEGQPHPVTNPCSTVFVFEHSCRASDQALINRGERYQKFVEEMTKEGAGPGPADRYINAKKFAEFAPIPDHIKNLIVEGT
ncbi:MAG: glycosyltransferase [Novosphingobium sp.]|nr:glycosyltransferase [Novosphingobium sp.]